MSIQLTTKRLRHRYQAGNTARATAEYHRMHLPSIVFVLAVAIFTTGFFASGVYLRFSNTRFEKEISQLQFKKAALNSEINGLRGANKSLQDPSVIYAYAVNELGLAPYGAERVSLGVSEKHYAAYNAKPLLENTPIRKTAMEDAMEIIQKFQSYTAEKPDKTRSSDAQQD